MSYNSIYRRDLFRDHIVVITGGGSGQASRCSGSELKPKSRRRSSFCCRRRRAISLAPASASTGERRTPAVDGGICSRPKTMWRSTGSTGPRFPRSSTRCRDPCAVLTSRRLQRCGSRGHGRCGLETASQFAEQDARVCRSGAMYPDSSPSTSAASPTPSGSSEFIVDNAPAGVSRRSHVTTTTHPPFWDQFGTTYIALTTWYMLKELMRAPDRAQIPESVSTTDHS